MINKLSITLSITAVAATVCLVQPAMAQDAGGPAVGNARFVYSPNVYRMDSTERKKPMMTLNPMAGSAPRNLLGISPTLFAKPAPAPAPAPKVAAAPRLIATPFTHASMQQAFGTPIKPQPLVAPPAVAYKAQFGKPLEVKPPVVAMQPKPQTVPHLPETKSPAAAPRHPVVAYNSGRNVHAILRNPGVLTGNHAAAASLPQIASYGNNVGYVPGAVMPHIGSGSGNTTSTAVSATLMNKRRR